MKGKFGKIGKHKKLTAYLLALAIFSTYVVMDTFVITRVYSSAEGDGTEASMELSSDDKAQDTQDDTEGDDTETEKGHSRGNKPDGAPESGQHKGRPGSGSKPDGKPGSRPEKGSKSGSGSSSAGSSSKSSEGTSSDSSSEASSGTDISSTASTDSFSDGKISIKLNEYTVDGTAVYAAEVSLDSAAYLKTALAQGSYGKNVTEETSDIAESVDAILAINGDYYGAQEKGYVIRNGTLYRSTAASDSEDLVIYKDGSFGIINESEVTAEQLIEQGAVQTLSFGPALIEDGELSVDSEDEVDRAMASNPRTAIGIKADGTYLFVVSDGRTDESEGLTLLQLAEFMQSLGAETAYNLDGGGSSTMVFNGTVVNTPTGGGFGSGSGSERKVSDIVYIGY